MRLLLVDGSIVNVAEYTKGTISVDATLIQCVNFTVEGYTEAEMQQILSDPAKCVTMKLYNNDNQELEDFIGYQKRVSTSIGPREKTYIITMGKGNDLIDRVEDLEKTMKEVINRVEMTAKTVTEISNTISETGTVVNEIKKSLDTISKQYNDFRETAKNLVETDGMLKKSVDEAIASANSCVTKVDNFGNTLSSWSETIRSIDQQFNDHTMTIDDLVQRVRKLEREKGGK